MSPIRTSAENKTVPLHSPPFINSLSSFGPLKTSTPLRFAPKLSPTIELSSSGRESNTDRLRLIDVGDSGDCKIPEYEGKAAVIIVHKWSIRSSMMKCSQKCYLELRNSHLYQFFRRSISIRCGNNRDAYYKKASKILKLEESGWGVTCYINSAESYFEVHHTPTGQIYRYICKDEADTTEWCKHIRATIKNALLRTSAKLSAFD